MLIHWTPTLYNQKKPPHSPWPPRQNSDGMQLWHLWRRSVAQTYATRRSVRFAKAHEKSLVGGDWIPYMSSSHHQYEFYMGLGLSHKIYEFYDFHFIYGMSSQPHWRTPSFFRGVGQPDKVGMERGKKITSKQLHVFFSEYDDSWMDTA